MLSPKMRLPMDVVIFEICNKRGAKNPQGIQSIRPYSSRPTAEFMTIEAKILLKVDSP